MPLRSLLLRAAVPLLFAGCPAPARDAPSRATPVPSVVASAIAAVPSGSAAAPSAQASTPASASVGRAPDAWPRAPAAFARVAGVYWPESKEPEEQRDGMAALTLDEVGRAWMFLRVDRDWLGFVVSASEGPSGLRLEAAAGVELPGALEGARFRVEGGALVEEHGGSAARRGVRDRAEELALLAPGTKLDATAPSPGFLQANGPLLVGHQMGRGADECWVGLAFPQPPAARRREKARPGRLVGVWIGDSLKPAAGTPCGLAAQASTRPVEVGGAIADLVLLGDRRGPLALVAVGYMAALVFTAPGRASDPALARAVEEGLRAAE